MWLKITVLLVTLVASSPATSGTSPPAVSSPGHVTTGHPVPGSTKHVTTKSSPTTLQSHKTNTPKTSGADPRANKTVCYPVVGCFDNFPPFDNTDYVLPARPESIDTGFWLYTRDNSDTNDFNFLNYSDPLSVQVSRFDSSRKTKVVCHGFQNTGNTSWVQLLKDALLHKEDVNVIVVDWGEGAKFPDYDQAAANTRLIGTQTRLLIEMLMTFGLKFDDLHLMGHSLGAQSMGYAGMLLKSRVARISGFDAAGPSFENKPALVRLDKTDALFVDATHTNAGTFGITEQSGHVDFYVNGGKNQAGCPNNILSGAISSLFKGSSLGGTVSCSHSRSHDFYIESILTTCPFTAYPCSDYAKFQKGQCLTCGARGCGEFGYNADQYSARGVMFLNTAAKKPYCGFQYAAEVVTGDGVKDTDGKLLAKLTGKWGTTDFFPLTSDTSLTASSTIHKVSVSPAEVGDITRIDVKYVKHTGFWFSSGENTFAVKSVKVTSGESGATFLACFGNRVLNHNKVERSSTTSRRQC